MKLKSRYLHILMNGILVGQLEKTPDGKYTFTYNQTWLALPNARPLSLSLPLINKPFVGDVVYHFFDNLLPDNVQIRSQIQTKFRIASNQPFDLLANIGKDCIGAIQILEGNIPHFKKEILFETISNNDIASTLRSLKTDPLGMSDHAGEFRISIAGAQKKTAFLYYKNNWCRPLKTTPTTHIFKLPIGIIQHQQLDLSESCENEWLCAQIGNAFGIPVADCEVCYFKEIKVLVVERFDRKLASDGRWMIRLPQEDMCQALGVSPNLKYQSDGGPGIEDIMRLLLGSTQPIEDRDMFFRAQVLFFLLAAIDGHAKNFSLFIDAGGKFHLTPLYDIISAHPMMANKQLQEKRAKMAMALKGKVNHYHWHDIQRRHFIQTAIHAQFSPLRAEKIIDDLLEKMETVIEAVTQQLPKTFPTKISTAIFSGMRLAKRRLEK